MTPHLTIRLPSMQPRLVSGAAFAGLAAMCLAVSPTIGGRALAQTDPAATATVEELIILAPHVHRMPGGVGRHGQQLEIVTRERRVTYSDLDLTQPSAAVELRSRITEAAKEACAELEALAPSRYGTPTASEQNCEQAAKAEAFTQVDQLVAAARAD